MVVDSQIFAEVGKDLGKEFPMNTDFPKEEGGIYQNLTNENTRAILAVKLIQLLKLRKDGQQGTITFILNLLNNNTLSGKEGNFYEILYTQF